MYQLCPNPGTRIFSYASLACPGPLIVAHRRQGRDRQPSWVLGRHRASPRPADTRQGRVVPTGWRG